MENINVDKVFHAYGLEVQQVEPYVYRSLNINNETDVEGLQADLMNCILIPPFCKNDFCICIAYF